MKDMFYVLPDGRVLRRRIGVLVFLRASGFVSTWNALLVLDIYI